MRARMNEGHDGRPGFRGIERAPLVPLCPLLLAAVDLADSEHHVFLPAVFYKLILLPGDVQDGLGLKILERLALHSCGRSDSSKNIAAGSPQQIGEAAAVGVSGGINSPVIEFVIGFERSEHGIEKLEVAVALIANGALPAGELSFGIGESAGSVEALGINDDRFRPEGVNVEGA